MSLYALLVVGGLNTVLSLFYYVKVLKVMILEKSLEETEGRPVETIEVPFLARSLSGFLGGRGLAARHLLGFAGQGKLSKGRRQFSGDAASESSAGRPKGEPSLMDAATAAILQDMVRKEGRSLLQYVGESFPWTTAKNHHGLAGPFKHRRRKSKRRTAAIVHILSKIGVRPPYLGAYPMSFTTINYMSLDYLFRSLMDFEKRRIAELEKSHVMVRRRGAETSCAGRCSR